VSRQIHGRKYNASLTPVFIYSWYHTLLGPGQFKWLYHFNMDISEILNQRPHSNRHGDVLCQYGRQSNFLSEAYSSKGQHCPTVQWQNPYANKHLWIITKFLWKIALKSLHWPNNQALDSLFLTSKDPCSKLSLNSIQFFVCSRMNFSWVIQELFTLVHCKCNIRASCIAHIHHHSDYRFPVEVFDEGCLILAFLKVYL